MDALQNKYDRLCAAYKKLRNVHNSFKESTLLELKETKDNYDRLVDEIQRKSENTNSTKADLSGCLQSKGNGTTPIQMCPACGYTEQTGGQLMPENVDSLPRSEIEISSTDPRSALDRFTEALLEWSNPVFRDQKRESSYLKTMEDSQSRIAELECQLCDLSLQYQMERKRRQLSGDALDHRNRHAEENSDRETVLFDIVEHAERNYEKEKRLLLEFMRKRIESANTLAQSAVARANMFENELRALVPHLKHVARELTELQEHCVSQAELHSAYQSDMLNRNNNMAEEMANLTAEVQHLRAGYSSQP